MRILRIRLSTIRAGLWDFPGGPVGKNLPVNAEDSGSMPGLRRFHMLRSNEAHAPRSTEAPRPGACAPQEKEPGQ